MTDRKKELMTKVFNELRSLVGKSFPKHCMCCGKTFENLEQYLAETKDAPHGSGFLKADDYESDKIVDLLRNCTCGSTLMIVFNERRDTTQRGIEMRAAFGELLELLTSHGIERETARTELLKFTKGEDSELLKEHGLPANISQMDDFMVELGEEVTDVDPPAHD